MIEMIRDANCHFCDGRGNFVSTIGDFEIHTRCEGCQGTGMDDPELYLIMAGKLVPPVDGCGTTLVAVR